MQRCSVVNVWRWMWPTQPNKESKEKEYRKQWQLLKWQKQVDLLVPKAAVRGGKHLANVVNFVIAIDALFNTSMMIRQKRKLLIQNHDVTFRRSGTGYRVLVLPVVPVPSHLTCRLISLSGIAVPDLLVYGCKVLGYTFVFVSTAKFIDGGLNRRKESVLYSQPYRPER